MASNNQQKTQSAPAQDETRPVAAEIVADDKTKTVYGVTLGELIAQQVRERETLVADAAAKGARVTELETKLNQVETENVGMKTLIAALRPYRTLAKLEGGGVRLPIELDADTAERYLAQAEDAREDPQEYIQRNLSEALLAYANA